MSRPRSGRGRGGGRDHQRRNGSRPRRHAPQSGLQDEPQVQVELAPRAAKEIHSLPLTIQNRMLHTINRLGRWPHVRGVKRLRGKLEGRLRVRTGDYRVVFRAVGRRVVVERVGHRNRVYDN